MFRNIKVFRNIWLKKKNEVKVIFYCNNRLFYKDDIFDVYHKTGSYANLTGRVRQQNYTQNRYDLYNVLFWLCIVLVPSVCYSIYALLTGSWWFRLGIVALMMSSSKNTFLSFNFKVFTIFHFLFKLIF
jgi:hypothetical protein